MVLLEPGHFQNTHFPANHWQTSNQHWSMYGYVAPSPADGGMRPRRRMVQRVEPVHPVPRELLVAVQSYLLMKQKLREELA